MADHLSRITVTSGLCGGRPCIRGMRVRVSDLVDLLNSGLTHEQVLDEMPDLERADITAAVQYAALHPAGRE